MNANEDYISTLEHEFRLNGNAEIAKGQQAYMKDNFVFFGLKTDLRRQIQKPFLHRDFLPSKKDAKLIVGSLWEKNERDFQLFGQELLFKYVKSLEKADISLLEYMIVNKSWWDTVDFIAVKLVGAYFKKFPEKRDLIIQEWLKSDNIWLKRSAILFQLKYKRNLDEVFLAEVIKQNFGTKEFFINKAIGWVLREYTRTNPAWVIAFVEEYSKELSNLSKKEALRLVI